LSCWCSACRNAYYKTAKAKEARKSADKRYDNTAKGKAKRQAFNRTAKGQTRKDRYERSEQGKATRNRYIDTRKSKAVFDLGGRFSDPAKTEDDFTQLEIDSYLRELERRKEKIRADKHR